MDSVIMKIGIFIVGVSMAKFMPSSLTTLLVFLLGIILTLAIEAGVLYFYVLYKCPCKFLIHKNSDSEDSANKETPKFIRSSRKMIFNKNILERRLSCIQCICNDSKFEVLVSDSDQMFSELLTNMKELLNNEKKYNSGQIKLGEISIIEKLKSRKSMNFLKNFREFLFETGQKYAKEADNLLNSVIPFISTVEKENKKKYKNLSLSLKNAGEKFCHYSNEIQKLSSKYTEAQIAYKKANDDFNHAKKDLAQFETLVKKEMKVKKINNDIMNIKNQIFKLKELMNDESSLYLEKASEIIKEVVSIDKTKALSYSSFIQTWLKFLLNK